MACICTAIWRFGVQERGDCSGVFLHRNSEIWGTGEGAWSGVMIVNRNTRENSDASQDEARYEYSTAVPVYRYAVNVLHVQVFILILYCIFALEGRKRYLIHINILHL